MDLLFVCLGNICRSPAAEGVALVLSRGDSRIGRIDSAGMGPWHAGNPPHVTMCEVARAAGYPIDDLRARQVDRSDFFEFDWILAMDRQNQRDLLALQATFGGKAKIRLLLDGAPERLEHGGMPVPMQDCRWI